MSAPISCRTSAPSSRINYIVHGAGVNDTNENFIKDGTRTGERDERGRFARVVIRNLILNPIYLL